MVQGTANQEVPITKKKEVPPLRHLLTVLGQYQRSLGTDIKKSWDSGLGTVILGQWSWDTSLGTVVLGQWSWDTSFGIVVLGQWSWDSGLGTGVLGH